MKRNFYLQHQLMAMHDPRMQNLFDEEGPRGIGTYWIIIEKLSLLPDAKAQLKYLRSSTNKKLSITYIEKIIRNFQLFVLEEDGSFSPEELNQFQSHTSLAGNGGRTGRENTLAGSSLHTQRLRRAADATHQGGRGLLQETYRSLRQMAQPVERKRCTLLFCEFHKSRTAHFASPVRNPPGTRCQATVRRTTRPLPLRTAHRRPTHLPGLSHPRQCPAPAGQHRFLE